MSNFKTKIKQSVIVLFVLLLMCIVCIIPNQVHADTVSSEEQFEVVETGVARVAPPQSVFVRYQKVIDGIDFSITPYNALWPARDHLRVNIKNAPKSSVIEIVAAFYKGNSSKITYNDTGAVTYEEATTYDKSVDSEYWGIAVAHVKIYINQVMRDSFWMDIDYK